MFCRFFPLLGLFMIYSSCIWHHTSYPSQLCPSGVMTAIIRCTFTDALMLFSWSAGCILTDSLIAVACSAVHTDHWPLCCVLCVWTFSCWDWGDLKGVAQSQSHFIFLCSVERHNNRGRLITLIQTTGFVWHHRDILSLASFLVSLYEESLPLI